MSKPATPESIISHAPNYAGGAWLNYTMEELGQWVSLLTKRAGHRLDPEKREKDLYDAQNYLNMMQAHLEYAKTLKGASAGATVS